MIIRAAQFAENAHAGQVRKHSGRPYITHPIRVAGRVACHPLASTELVAAAFLHDVVEDCGVTLEEIKVVFGGLVAHYVSELTNTSKSIPGLDRAGRKAVDEARVATISDEAKVVKLIDRIDNLRETDPNDPFSLMYAMESLDLLKALKGVDIELEEELDLLAKGFFGTVN